MAKSKNRDRRRREVLITGGLFAIPLLILFPYWPWKPSAEFVASIHSDAVTLKIGGGERPRADREARAFASNLVNLTIEGAEQFEFSAESPRRCNSFRVTHAQISSFLLMRGTTVYIQSQGRNGVRLQLQFPSDLSQAPLQLFMSDDSDVHCDGSAVTPALPGPIRAVPHNATLAVELAAVDMHGVAAHLTDAYVPALEDMSAISFATTSGANGIHPFDDNSLEVVNASRKIQIGGEIVDIANVRANTAVQIATDEDGLSVRIKGSARRLAIGGGDARPSWVEFMQTRHDVTAWLATAILIGSTALTVLTRLKLIQLEEKR